MVVRTLPIFAILFLLVPILEITLLIQVGSVIGAPLTILCVVLTAVLGAYLLRQQGLSTLARFQQSLAQGEVPATQMLEGIVLIVGGALLMTPGFFTDAIGFACLFPLTRMGIVKYLVKHSKMQVMGGHTQGGFGQSPFDQQNSQQSRPTRDGHYEYEGEYTRKEDDRLP